MDTKKKFRKINRSNLHFKIKTILLTILIIQLVSLIKIIIIALYICKKYSMTRFNEKSIERSVTNLRNDKNKAMNLFHILYV